MRTFLTIFVSLVFGVLIGIFVARIHFFPRLVSFQKKNEELAQENQRLSTELQLASERLKFMEMDFASLQKQLDQLLAQGSGTPLPRIQQASASTPSTTEETQINEPPTTSQTSPSNTTRDSQAAENPSRTPASDAQIRVEQERVRIQDFLQYQIETSSDPAERARLSRLQQNMENIRDLLGQISTTYNPEERQAIIREVARTRTEMRDIVLEQRASMVRQTLQQVGINDPAQQEHIVSTLEQILESPYYSDPMLIWGMAPRRETTQ